jgi:hypothetical protein
MCRITSSGSRYSLLRHIYFGSLQKELLTASGKAQNPYLDYDLGTGMVANCQTSMLVATIPVDYENWPNGEIILYKSR